jgi:hypothetical protein
MTGFGKLRLPRVPTDERRHQHPNEAERTVRGQHPHVRLPPGQRVEPALLAAVNSRTNLYRLLAGDVPLRVLDAEQIKNTSQGPSKAVTQCPPGHRERRGPRSAHLHDHQ